MSEQFDAIVIGAGQSGGPLSSALQRAGHRVAMVERDAAGGTCINRGCTPTKAMVASARVAYLADRAADYGVNTGPVSVDMEVVRARKRDIVASWSSGSQNSIEDSGVTYIKGEARFKSEKSLTVTLDDGSQRELAAEMIFINTGMRPFIPPVDGLADVPYLDSTSIMELDEVPGHLIVLGGGYIGLEFGQMFRRFGANVTIIQRGDALMPREDEDVQEAIEDILDEDGITILTGANAETITEIDGEIEVTFTQDGGPETVRGSHILIATGRRPNTEALDLPAAGVEVNGRGFIAVNDRLETNIPGIYAMGDVTGAPAFTHISYDDFRILRENILNGGNASREGRMVPYTAFIDPQLAHIGLSEKDAKAEGIAYRLAKLPMSSVARAIETQETRGFMKALVDPGSGLIFGATVLGIEGGEIMAVLQMAMMGDVPYTAIRDGIFAHPTLAESLNNLFMTLD